MASSAGIGEWPELIKEIFLTKTKNAAGIHGVKLYIRGKPWVISIDDYLLFKYPIKYQYEPS